MIVVKKITKNDDGNYTSEWNLSEDQMRFLLTFSINQLVAEGLVQVEEHSEPDVKQQQLDFLENINPEEMFQS